MLCRPAEIQLRPKLQLALNKVLTNTENCGRKLFSKILTKLSDSKQLNRFREIVTSQMIGITIIQCCVVSICWNVWLPQGRYNRTQADGSKIDGDAEDAPS